MEIKVLQSEIQRQNYRISTHAVKRMIQRSIDRLEIEEVILNGGIIEEYPK